jgi:hypothetical protein
MPIVPKPKPPKKCACPTCKVMRDNDLVRKTYMGVIAVSYRREELQALVRTSRASMLPQDPS